MIDKKMVLVLGGARSGKSTFAEEYADSLGQRVLYVATAAPLDEEMKQRIQLHRDRRPAHWTTVEETKEVAQIISSMAKDYDVILIDCLTLLLTNLILDANFPEADTVEISAIKEEAIMQEMTRLAKAAALAETNVILVSNEAGLGLVPTYELGRFYRDNMGRANQTMASYADEVYFTIAGLPIEIKEIGTATKKRLLGEG
jgi:adenosylcobinamide kinase / adenosylcobinamide-phosphate guanylyltransferase